MANKNAIIVGVVVVIIAVAAVAVFALNNNNGDKDKTPVLGVGDSMTFYVFGTLGNDGTLIDGTTTMKVLDETDTQYKIETEQSVYAVGTDGEKTELYVGKNTDWEDKDDDDDMVAKGTLTVDTFWGEKKLSYYESSDGTTHALTDGDIVYAIMIKNISDESNITMYMELTECTAIKDKKADREIHEAEFVLKGDYEQEGSVFVLTMTCDMDNKKSEIFIKQDLSLEMALKDQPESSVKLSSQTSWGNPFGEDASEWVNIGTEEINTEWGTKMTDVYGAVVDGNIYNQYLYKGVLVRYDIDENGVEVTLDATSIVIDGKSVTLDEAAEL